MLLLLVYPYRGKPVKREPFPAIWWQFDRKKLCKLGLRMDFILLRIQYADGAVGFVVDALLRNNHLFQGPDHHIHKGNRTVIISFPFGLSEDRFQPWTIDKPFFVKTFFLTVFFRWLFITDIGVDMRVLIGNLSYMFPHSVNLAVDRSVNKGHGSVWLLFCHGVKHAHQRSQSDTAADQNQGILVV